MIKKRVTAEKDEIYWGNETVISNQEYYQRGFSPKGVTHVILAESRQDRISMIFAITSLGDPAFYDKRRRHEPDAFARLYEATG